MKNINLSHGAIISYTVCHFIKGKLPLDKIKSYFKEK